VAAIVLAIIGVASVLARLWYPAELTFRIEPVRNAVMERFDRTDPLASQREAVLQRFEGRYAAHPVVVYVHVIAGGVFLALLPLQFSASVRRRFVRWHRWSGRLLLVLAIPATITGLWFGVLMPISGAGEATVIALVAAFFVVSLTRAFRAIRRGDVAAHREWMIRAASVAFGVALVRITGLVVDFTLTPRGIPITQLFVVAMWSGWLLTTIAAELWIRWKRSVKVPVRMKHAATAAALLLVLAFPAQACGSPFDAPRSAICRHTAVDNGRPEHAFDAKP
jgi:uncharacterized membrane protein